MPNENLKQPHKLLEIKHLKKYFPLQTNLLGKPRAYLKAVDDISFDLSAGKTIGIVGESGCGKTTLGRTILRLYQLTGGKIIYYGRNIDEFLPKYYIRDIRAIPKKHKQYIALKNRILWQISQCDELDTGRQLAEKLPAGSYSLALLEAAAKEVEKLAGNGAEKKFKPLQQNLMKLRELLEETASTTGGLFLFDEAKQIKKNLLDKHKEDKRLLKLTEVKTQNEEKIKNLDNEYPQRLEKLQQQITALTQTIVSERLKSLDSEKQANELFQNLVGKLNTEDYTVRDLKTSILEMERLELNQNAKPKKELQKEIVSLLEILEERAEASEDSMEYIQQKKKLFGLHTDKELKKLLKQQLKDKAAYRNQKLSCQKKLEKLYKEIAELSEVPASEALEALEEKRKANPLVQELSGKQESGLDLTRLTAREMRSLRQEIQLIFQDPYSSLPPRMTIGAIIGEAVKVHKIVPKSEIHDYVHSIMKKCGLQPQYYDRYPHEFSGGQRQRICIARALAVNPKLVICDEPVSALDVSIQAQIINLLKDLQKDMGLTYIFISHDLSVVKYITDDILVMYLGNTMEKGETEAIFKNPLHPYTQALFSAVPVPNPDEKMNRIILKGDIPSPANPPKGCKFHTRCVHCMSACRLETPKFTEVEKGHYVACHLYQPEILSHMEKYDRLAEQQDKEEEELSKNKGLKKIKRKGKESHEEETEVC